MVLKRDQFMMFIHYRNPACMRIILVLNSSSRIHLSCPLISEGVTQTYASVLYFVLLEKKRTAKSPKPFLVINDCEKILVVVLFLFLDVIMFHIIFSSLS